MHHAPPILSQISVRIIRYKAMIWHNYLVEANSLPYEFRSPAQHGAYGSAQPLAQADGDSVDVGHKVLDVDPEGGGSVEDPSSVAMDRKVARATESSDLGKNDREGRDQRTSA